MLKPLKSFGLVGCLVGNQKEKTKVIFCHLSFKHLGLDTEIGDTGNQSNSDTSERR